jgi:hypothetical protein
MKQIFGGFNWVFGIFVLVATLFTFGSAPLPALPLAAIALLSLPPSREFIFGKLPWSLPRGTAFAAIAVLFLSFIVLIVLQENGKHEEIKEQKATRTIDDEQMKYAIGLLFKDTKPKVMEEAAQLILAKDYKQAISITNPYLVTDDPDLFKINAKAKNELANLEIAVAQAKKKADEHEAKITRQFNPWDGSHRALEKAIKETMNDPDSYKHVETRYGDRGDYLTLVTKIRGKNAFGGVITSTVRARVDIDGSNLQILD